MSRIIPSAESELRHGQPATVLFFADQGGLRLGVVQAVQPGKRVVLLEDGSRQVMREPRLFWMGRVAQPVAALAAYRARLEAARAEVQLRALWEATAFEPPFTVLSLAERAGFDEATPMAEREDILAWAIFSDPSYFRLKDQKLTRLDAKRVRENEQRRAAKEALEEKLRRGGAAIRAKLEGAPYEEGDLEQIAASLFELAAKGKQARAWGELQGFLEPLGYRREDAGALLMRLGLMGPFSDLTAYRMDLPGAFSPEVEAELARLREDPPGRPSLDKRGLQTVAIDAPGTSEVDDALAMEGKRLWVFIADLAAWVGAGGAIDKAARSRAATIYLPGGKIPMLPAELGQDLASLVEGEARRTLSISFEIGEDGRLEGIELQHAVIQLHGRLDYDEGDAILAAPESATDYAWLAEMEAALDRHRARRHRHGALSFERMEVGFDVLEGGEIRVLQDDPQRPIRLLIQEAMIAACAATASFCADRQIPCIYRAQEPPSEELDLSPAEGAHVRGLERQANVLRQLKPSQLQTRPQGHATLGLPSYTQITSPLRRYADLVMHQQLRAFLRTSRPLYSAGALEDVITQLGPTLMTIREAERESRKFHALAYLEGQIGEVFEGRILREVGKKSLVNLEAVALTWALRIPRGIKTGALRRFRVIHASARQGTLELEELGP